MHPRKDFSFFWSFYEILFKNSSKNKIFYFKSTDSRSRMLSFFIAQVERPKGAVLSAVFHNAFRVNCSGNAKRRNILKFLLFTNAYFQTSQLVVKIIVNPLKMSFSQLISSVLFYSPILVVANKKKSFKYENINFLRV